MDNLAIPLLIVGTLWVAVFKIWAATVMLKAAPQYGALVLLPPISFVVFFDEFEKLWLPTLLGTPGAILGLWGLLLLVL